MLCIVVFLFGFCWLPYQVFYFLVSLKFQLRSALPKFDLCAPRLLSHQPTFAP